MGDLPAGAQPLNPSPPADDQLSFRQVVTALQGRLRLIAGSTLATAVLTYGATYLIAPTFTAKTTFLPPQQQQSSASAALAQLGSLAALAGGAGAVRTPADQYVALMQSVTVSDHIIDRFKLMEVYAEKYRVDARKELSQNVRINAGRKDGLITVEVDDKLPQRAADMANSYVDELRRMTSTLAVTEAQQRRVFFEQQMQQTRDRLTKAQQSLESSGISQGALKAEPKAAAEGYARLRAQITAGEVRLQALRNALADDAPEVRSQQAALAAMHAQIARAERADEAGTGADYVSRYREFKYQETLFDLLARQYELARVDESREGALVQVVDVALVPEKKSRPKRVLTALTASFVVCAVLCLVAIARRRTSRPS